MFRYDLLLTVDLLLGRDLPFFFLALMLLTKEFLTPSLFFLPPAFFAAFFLGLVPLPPGVFFAAFFLGAPRLLAGVL